LSTAFGSQAFFVHFVMKLFSAAPDAGLRMANGRSASSKSDHLWERIVSSWRVLKLPRHYRL
jgi:hypothetical protein